MLAAAGQQVVGCDAASPEGAEGLSESGVEVHLDTDGVELVEAARCLVKSPGVPDGAPALGVARRRGLPVLGELELAWRLVPGRFVAVTGTNGKTTVTELLGHVWRTAGEPVAVAGNVGTPVASLAGSVADDATVVCECSSFQLSDSELFAPECGVLLNITPDHLDRHGDLESYLAAKLRVFANQGNDDVAVFNASDPAFRDLDLGGCARRVAYCRGGDPDCEVALVDRVIFADGAPPDRRRRPRPSGPAQRRQCDGRRGGGPGDGDRPSLGHRRAPNLSRRTPPASSGSPSSTASHT